MKAKLLRKMRSRTTMTFDTNAGNYPYKLTIRVNTITGVIASRTFKSKEELFEAYRDSIVYWSFRIYGCRKRQKLLEVLTHNL